MDTTTRITRECALNDLDPTLRDALRAHAVQHQMGDLENTVLMCCETTSVRKPGGLFGGTQNSISAALVTPKWLIWADSSNRNDAGIGGAELLQIDIHDYASTAMFAIAPDMGLNVSGRFTSSQKTGRTFIALDTGPAGTKFRQVLEEARKIANK